MKQLSLFDEMPTAPSSLRDYDWIIVNSSAGKDSMAMLDLICQQAEREDWLNRVVVVHADLGRVEWQGTKDLAAQQAARYGVKFLTVRRKQGDLLQHIEARREQLDTEGKFDTPAWPSSTNRYCTSDHKRAQVDTMFTSLTTAMAKVRSEMSLPVRRIRILNCMGMRADESPARAKRPPFDRGDVLRANKKGQMVYGRATNGKRIVDEYLPLHQWTERQVWERIRCSRCSDLIHPAYGLGMPRLSCCFCIFAPKAALVLAGRHNPELLAEYVRVEQKIGHKFRLDVSMADVAAAVKNTSDAGPIDNWKM